LSDIDPPQKQNQTQISALEAEIAKLQKSTDTMRAAYQSLQKQYQEQCSESERHRESLRRRDTEIKEYLDAAGLHTVEADKWNNEQQVLEDRINQLTVDLELAQQAFISLDEQKAENVMLKETIDRLRFELDEMRSNAANGLEQSKDGAAGNASSVGRTLGAEMARAGADPEDIPPKPTQQEESEDDTIVDEIINQESDDDEYIQTVITKTRKRVRSPPFLAEYMLITLEHRRFMAVCQFQRSVLRRSMPMPRFNTTSPLSMSGFRPFPGLS
jgi:chromosome segregation ATPase